MTHAFVRGTFSSSGVSPGGGSIRKKAGAGPDPDDLWEEDVLDAHMSIGDTMALLDMGFRKTAADSDVAMLFGIYERPDPSFSGCFRPIDRAMPDTGSGCRCEPIVRQEQILPPDRQSRADMIAAKWRRHRERITGKG